MTTATSRRRRRWPIAAAVAIAVAALSGCGFPDRREAADAIGEAIQAMPGVDAVDVDYNTSFDGGANFTLTVVLSAMATNAEGASAGRTFVEKLTAADFAQFHVELDLVYVRPHSGADSKLVVTYQPDLSDGALHADPSPDEVAEGVTWWLDIARSPAVAAVAVTLPLDHHFADVDPPLRVELPVDADDVVLAELIRRHPQLDSAVWSVAIPAADRYVRERSYTSVGRFLDRHSRQVWQRIVAQLGPNDSAEASTQLPPKPDRPPTTVKIGWGFDYGRDNDFSRVARGVTALLAELPGPVRFTLDTRAQDPATGNVVDQNLTVTVGGCTAPDPRHNHPDGSVEAELRHRYERC